MSDNNPLNEFVNMDIGFEEWDLFRQKLNDKLS